MKKSFLFRAASMFVLLAFFLSSCTISATGQVKIKTEPAGAEIYKVTGSGLQKMGTAPVDVSEKYHKELNVLGGATLLAILGSSVMVPGIIYRDNILGILALIVGGATVALSVAVGIAGIADPEIKESNVKYLAKLDGFGEKEFDVTYPSKDDEIFISLDEAWYRRYGIKSAAELSSTTSISKLIPALADTRKEVRLEAISALENMGQMDLRLKKVLSDTAESDTDPEVRERAENSLRKMKLVSLAEKESGKELVVAVFDVFDPSGRFEGKILEQLTAFLATKLAETGRFKVVPRDQLRERLREEKKESYRACYEESCQIELGKEVAAQVTLSTQLIKVGNKCMVTANLYDLRSATSIKGGAVESGCSEDDLVGGIQELAFKIAEP